MWDDPCRVPGPQRPESAPACGIPRVIKAHRSWSGSSSSRTDSEIIRCSAAVRPHGCLTSDPHSAASWFRSGRVSGSSPRGWNTTSFSEALRSSTRVPTTRRMMRSSPSPQDTLCSASPSWWACLCLGFGNQPGLIFPNRIRFLVLCSAVTCGLPHGGRDWL